MLDRDWPNQLVELRLWTPPGESQGFFDWVELSALQRDADADWHAGPPGIDPWEFVTPGPGIGATGMDIRKK